MAVALFAYFFLPFLILIVVLWRPVGKFFAPRATDDWPHVDGPNLDVVASLIGIERRRWLRFFRERDVTLRRRIRANWSDRTKEGAWPQ